MSTYTTQAQLQKRISKEELARLAYDGETVVRDSAAATTLLADADVIANISQAITDGGNEIDSYVLGHLDITDSTNQAALERINATLALYALYARRQHPDETNPFSTSRKDALSWLKELQKRNLRTKVNPEAPAEMTVSTTANQTPVFRDRTSDTPPLENF